MRSRFWCARGAYEGKREFIFGTVMAEGYEDALAKLAVLWAEVMPFLPPTFHPVPGMLVFDGAAADA